MTSLCWNGKELFADTRIVHFVGETNRVEGHDDFPGLNKILLTKNMTIRGEKVKAVGCAGDIRLITALRFIDQAGKGDYPNRHPVKLKDMMEQDFYDALQRNVAMDSYLMVVAETTFHLISIKCLKAGMFGAIEWEANWGKKEETWFMAGSGAMYTNYFVDSIGGDIGKLREKGARESMSLAMGLDPHSGGDVISWSEEKGFERMPAAEIAYEVRMRRDEILADCEKESKLTFHAWRNLTRLSQAPIAMLDVVRTHESAAATA